MSILTLIALVLVEMLPFLLAWLAVVWPLGYFFGRKAILISGLISIGSVGFLIFYIPYYCHSNGPQPGQLFEGCGNVVGFYLWIVAFGTLPVVGAIMIASLAAIYLHHRRRSVQTASMRPTGERR